VSEHDICDMCLEAYKELESQIHKQSKQLHAADELARVQRELVRTMDDDHWFADDIKNALAAYEKATGVNKLADPFPDVLDGGYYNDAD